MPSEQPPHPPPDPTMAAKRLISHASATVLSCFLIFFGGDSLFPVAEAIWLTIPTTGSKCVSEEIQKNVVVLADFYSVDKHDADHVPTVSVRVISPLGNEVSNVQNVTLGKFAFTANEAGTYLACFSIDPDNQKSPFILALDWKIGIAAKDWDSVAKREKLEGVELHLRRLKEIAEAIRTNLLYIRYREAFMRKTNEETNRRVSQLSIMSLALCAVVSILQVWHLKRFFQKKKLI